MISVSRHAYTVVMETRGLQGMHSEMHNEIRSTRATPKNVSPRGSLAFQVRGHHQQRRSTGTDLHHPTICGRSIHLRRA